MRHRLVVAVVIVVIAIAALAGLAVPAIPVGATKLRDIGCGQVVTTDVVLRTDLTCSGDGLVIASSGVTVRLSGHTITSTDGTGLGVRLSQPLTGPGPNTCVQDVEILDGTISGFFAGIGTSSCRESYRPDDPLDGGRASGVTLLSNTWGIYTTSNYLIAVDHATIVGPNGVGGPFGRGASTGSAEVTASTIRVTAADGLSVLGAIGTRSSVTGSRLEGGRAFAIDSRLTVSASQLDGVTVECSDGGLAISDSRLTGGRVTGGLCGTSLSGNHVVGPGSGVALATNGATYPTSVTDNIFIGWGTAVVAGSFSTTVTGNTFRDNGIGVSCAAYCGGTVSDNRFRDNAGAGVELRGGTWRVGSNVAVGNGGLGIDAQGPQVTVIDDGGNIARRNQPPQCIGVVCTTHP